VTVGRVFNQVERGRCGWDEMLPKRGPDVCGPQQDERGQLPLPRAGKAEGGREPERRQSLGTEGEEWKGRSKERQRDEGKECRVTWKR
jgi:hypothetical protein